MPVETIKEDSEKKLKGKSSEGAKIVVTERVAGGEPRIEVADVVQYYTEAGWKIEKISQELKITPSQVLEALKYYYEHPKKIRKAIRSSSGESA